MVVQHNLAAFNANRQFNITSRSLAAATEKLSSGYKINKSADDAAGLSISEKMRKQIRGLSKAVENAEDGISLVQVADGAMNEIHDMLDRCYELSIKAANGTLSDSDRQSVQDELDQILTEIDSIREKTKFNEIYVLKGDQIFNVVDEDDPNAIKTKGENVPSWVTFGDALNTGHITETYVAYEAYSLDGTGADLTTAPVVHPAATVDFSQLTAANVNELIGTGFHTTCCTCTNYYSVEFVAGTDDEVYNSVNNYVYKIGVDGITSASDLIDKIVNAMGNGNPNRHYTKFEKDAADPNIMHIYDMRRSRIYSPDLPTGWNSDSKWMTGDNNRNNNLKFDAEPVGSYGLFGKGSVYSALDPNINSIIKLNRKQLDIHVGDEADMTNKIVIHLPAVSCRVLGIKDIDVMTEDNATAAISRFEKAKAFVSTERSRMGAYQNRMEHTVKNLDNVVENTQASESQIRDTDMAKQMVAYSNLSILAQAGQSMLAQANQMNQGVLSLLG